MMNENEETIVAVFDTADHASAAVRDLIDAGVPDTNITQHAGAANTASAGTVSAAPRQEPGFWSSLFGAEPEHNHDTTVYDRSLQGGGTVVSVRGSGSHLDQALDILERHNPIDIDERAASYGMMSAPTATMAPGLAKPAAYTGAAVGNTVGTGVEPATIQLSEETLAVGKRAINRGSTRVRRYVVERPVEEQVSLRDEHVTIERRPVTDARAVAGADFSDKVIEMTETAEEAVISKEARVKEEVVIRKDVTDRTETVRDTLRREDVEITKEPGTAKMGVTGGTTSPYKPAL